MSSGEKPTTRSRAAKQRELVRIQTVNLLQKSVSARQVRAEIRKAVAAISDSDLLAVRGIQILLLA